MKKRYGNPFPEIWFLLLHGGNRPNKRQRIQWLIDRLKIATDKLRDAVQKNQ